jgi:RNA polymerase-binding transcription factor DksA
MASLKEARKQILTHLEELRRRVGKIEKDLSRESNPLDPDWEEAAPTRGNDEILGALEVEGRDQIVACEAALRRIDEGTYGTCAACGQPISSERLKALPYAITCIDCAKKTPA